MILVSGSGKLAKELEKLSTKSLPINILSRKEMDITNEYEVSNVMKDLMMKPNYPKYFIHTAALTKPMDVNDRNPLMSLDTNIVGTANVAKMCSKYGIKFVYISTDFVYGDKELVDEESELKPSNNYGWSKLGGECVARLIENSLILRCSLCDIPFRHKVAFNDVFRNSITHKDVANIILGKDAQRQFTKKLDTPEAKEVEAKQLTAEQLTDIALAKEKIQQAPNLRKSLVKGEKKGIDQELIDKIEATVVKTFGTKTLKPEAKGFRKSIENSYKIELKKPIADLMGKGPEYEVFLRENFDAIMKYIDKSFFVQMERLTPRKDRIFTEVEIERMNPTQTDKAIAEGRVPKNTNRDAGNTLWKFKKPAPAQFLKFYTGAGLGSTKGTRKDRLAEVIGIELAKDFTSEILSRPEVIAKIKEISLLELEGKADVVSKTPSPKIREAREMRFDNYVERVAAEIGRDPNLSFSFTAKDFKKQVGELKAAINKSQSIEDVIDLKNQKALKGDYHPDAVKAAIYGWNEGWVITAVSKIGGNLGTAYEIVSGTKGAKESKNIDGLDIKLNVTEKRIQLDPIGNFKGGNYQAPDLMPIVHNRQMGWELKFGDAVAGKNNAGFINYTKGTFERKQKRKNPKQEKAVEQALREAISQSKAVEAILREKGVLKPGEDFTSKTKIPLDVHNILSGRGGAKAKIKSETVKVKEDFISDYYND